MCKKQSYVWVKRGPRWEQQPKPCGHCWRCKRNYVNDYVGRSLCEASVSEACCTLTLTYAPRDDLADRVVTPHHFQLFMKLLRNAGHKVRYLAIGEYGTLEGRAHFHVILFFKKLVPLVDPETGECRGVMPRYKDDYPEGTTQDDAPFCREIPQKRMVHIREWPHGHILADWSASEKSIRYVCKYLLADEKAKDQFWFSPSKKPALGWEWFARKAARARELGVLPSSFEYMPPGGTKKSPYLMTGAIRRDYLAACAPRAADRPRMSEWVQRTYDKYERARRIEEAETAEKLRLRTEGFALPEPEQPEPSPDGHTAEWYSDRWAEELAAEVDPNHKWDYPSCPWTPLVGAGYGTSPRKGRPAFFEEDRIYNPKPRPAPRSVTGSGNLRRREGPASSRRRCSDGRYDTTPGAYPEADDARWSGGGRASEARSTSYAEAEGVAGPGTVDDAERSQGRQDL